MSKNIISDDRNKPGLVNAEGTILPPEWQDKTLWDLAERVGVPNLDVPKWLKERHFKSPLDGKDYD